METGQVDLSRPEWQRVVLPLAALASGEQMTGLALSSTFGGVFYLDDLRLQTAARHQPATAVTLQHTVLPRQVALDQNYPNPFNSGTVIRWVLPAAGSVRLEVYNLLGQQVAVLAQGPWEPGHHTVRWDGRDDHGRPPGQRRVPLSPSGRGVGGDAQAGAGAVERQFAVTGEALVQASAPACRLLTNSA